MIKVFEREDRGVTVITISGHLSGKLDDEGYHDFREALRKLECKKVVINLNGMVAFGAEAISIMFEYRVNKILASPSDHVTGSLTRAKMADIFLTKQTEEEAILHWQSADVV